MSWIIPRAFGFETRLVVKRKSTRRTCFGALLARLAELNQPKIDRFVVGHRHICKDLAQANRRTELRRDQLVEAAQFANTRIERERYALCSIVHARYCLIAETADKHRQR